MNHLAHALPFLLDDRPERIAGSLLPDWLRLIDKRARLRPTVELLGLQGETERERLLLTGVLRHHDDDEAFHADATFDALASDTGARIRAAFPGLRGSALGHILVEMWIDRHLMDDEPARLQRLYTALDALDVEVVAAAARRWTGQPLPGAEAGIARFTASRFLTRYASDDGLFLCLRGMWARALGQELPEALLSIVSDVGPQVRPLARAVAARASDAG